MSFPIFLVFSWLQPREVKPLLLIAKSLAFHNLEYLALCRFISENGVLSEPHNVLQFDFLRVFKVVSEESALRVR